VASRIVTRTPRTIVALSFIRDDRPEQQATENAGRDTRAVVTSAIMMPVAAVIAATAITLTTTTIVLLTAASTLVLDAKPRLTAAGPLTVLLVSAIRILHLANQALHPDQRRTIAKLRGNDEALDRTGWRGRGGRDQQAGAKQCRKRHSHIQRLLVTNGPFSHTKSGIQLRQSESAA
jgi:hypothetical protein